MKYDFHLQQFVETGINPDKLAVAGSDFKISWLLLKQGVESLADTLRHTGIPNGSPVIIYGHKEAAYAGAMLACIHSDITYIPIDTIYPEGRIRKIIETTNSQLIINCTQDEIDFGTALVIDRHGKLHTNHTAVLPDAHPDKDALQYIIFTSGSTGEPKGVTITRSSMLTFIDWSSKAFGFSGSDVFMNQAPFTFDVSLCDFLNAFGHGGTLILNSADVIKDQEAFLNRLIQYNCTVWTSTPSFAYLFLRHERFTNEQIPALTTFLFMGEELPNRTCGILHQAFENTRILNAYGPTEATIVTTLVEITPEIVAKYPLLPIGYPMTGSELLVEKINPEDKEGELIICGDHVSTGYFNNPDLNSQKFFIHNGKRAFRTGDLAYYENDLLFCIGRNDDQVKMHGFRIELNEISAVLCRHGEVKDAVTIALKRGSEVKKLVSFVISESHLNPDAIAEKVVPFLEENVPYYMVPGDIVQVEDFPYSASHKIDKKQLMADYLQQLR